MMLNLAPQRADRAAHLIILLITWLYVFINMVTLDYQIASIIGVVILFITFTWRRIMYIVITAAITLLLISLFPFLAPIAFIIMVIIFCLRLKYIVSHWRAVLGGFYMYGVGFYFAVVRSTTVETIPALLTGFVAAVGFHLILIWLYSHNYTLDRALPIMGVAPLLIILLCLPFIKVFGGFDAIADAADTAVDTAHHGGDIHGGSDAVTPAPGTHYTHDYYRTGPDGTMHHVRGYEATNPDGIVTNNYSYHGQSVPHAGHYSGSHGTVPAGETPSTPTDPIADSTLVADPGPKRTRDEED
ncbi:hypothetical protein [Megasphaera sp. DISK 18]|uniref:hypothetical protein n=1 Tax=Megasphaera sp. DISK 18 TaxID=1776081 RepID=UPI0011467AB7|nr:hypothetical protein [Megasphaera sp. DISK 18]